MILTLRHSVLVRLQLASHAKSLADPQPAVIMLAHMLAHQVHRFLVCRLQ